MGQIPLLGNKSTYFCENAIISTISVWMSQKFTVSLQISYILLCSSGDTIKWIFKTLLPIKQGPRFFGQTVFSLAQRIRMIIFSKEKIALDVGRQRGPRLWSRGSLWCTRTGRGGAGTPWGPRNYSEKIPKGCFFRESWNPITSRTCKTWRRSTIFHCGWASILSLSSWNQFLVWKYFWKKHRAACRFSNRVLSLLPCVCVIWI